MLAVILGFILEIAPFLLLSVTPLAPLASSAPVSIGNVGVASNQLVGAIFIVFGVGLYWSVRKRKRGG